MQIMPRRKWLAIWLFGGLLTALCACFVAFGFSIHMPGTLEAARARWETGGIENYRYRLQLVSPWYIGGGVYITVRDGEVEAVQRAGNLFGEPTTTPAARTLMSARPDWYAEHFSAWLPEDFNHYSADALFTFLEGQFQAHSQPVVEMCSSESRYEARYHERLGYIEDLRFTGCATWDVGLGLSCPALGDCSMGFHVSEFEVLTKE